MSAGADDNRAAIVMGLPSDEAGMQPVAVVVDWSVRTTIMHTAFWRLLGLAWLADHVMAVARLGSGGGVITLVLATLLYRRMPLAGLMVLFQRLEYQTGVISLMSADMSAESFRFSQDTSFFVASMCAVQALFRMLCDPVERSVTRRLAVLACVTLGVGLAYAALGTAVSSLGSAVVGLRDATNVLTAVLIGIDVGRIWGYHTVAIGYLLSLVLGGGLTIMENTAPADYYFQEEAYFPYALGLLMLFCGVLIGNDRRVLRHEPENHPGNLQMALA